MTKCSRRQGERGGPQRTESWNEELCKPDKTTRQAWLPSARCSMGDSDELVWPCLKLGLRPSRGTSIAWDWHHLGLL